MPPRRYRPRRGPRPQRKRTSAAGAALLEAQAPVRPAGPVELPSSIAVKDFAETLGVSIAEIINVLIKNGIFATVNQAIDFDTASLVAAELGFEANIWKNMFALDFTWYNKNTHDALIQRQLPPSNGLQQLFFQNLGSVQNKGIELQLTGTPLKLKNFAWDFTINGSHNKNTVLNLGDSIAPIIFNNQRHQNGYPLGGYWARPYTFTDVNGDGAITTEKDRKSVV